MMEKRLTEVCEITMGQAPMGTSYNFDGKGLPLIAGAGDFGDSFPSPSKFTSSPGKISKTGDIIVCIRATIGDLNWADKEYCLGRGVAGLRAKSKELDMHYLWNWLRASKDKLEKSAKGSTFKQISRDDIASLKIPLPSPEEQKRIAGILDKADAICRKRAESLKLLDELLRATFLDMFGDPITNSKGLKKKPLKDFGTVVTGNTPSRADAENYGDYIEWIKSDNLNNPEHYLTKATEGLSAKGAKKSRLLPSGSILVTCIAGSSSCIGNAGIADREVAFNQQINAVIPFPDVDLYFLYAQILVAKKLIQLASTNAMKGMINKRKFENIRLLDPDKNIQKEAGIIFKKIIHEHSVFSTTTIESNTLFHSLVARAFKGEL